MFYSPTFALMFQIDNVLVSSELFEEEFVCNISACKGACCVQGSAGAPVLPEEEKIMQEILPIVKPYIPREGYKAIKRQGAVVENDFGELETPLLNGKECAYTVFSGNGTAMCGIELAHQDGKIDFQKPISCHLYPIRVAKVAGMDALNYHRWSICSDACTLGKELKMPVFKFLKDALTKAYGESFYEQLEVYYKMWLEQYKN